MLYRITETDAEIEARLAEWDSYLEEDEQETKSSNIGQNTSQ